MPNEAVIPINTDQNKSLYFKIMKLEQQVTTLEPSKRLKELVVKQESWFGYAP
jgi:hypothetical protein